MQYQVELLPSHLKEEAILVLKNAKNIPLFLLSNLTQYGLTLSEHPNSGNVYCIFHQGALHALFMLTRRGVLLTYTKENSTEVSKLIAQVCLKEPIKMHGLVGEYDFCQSLWRACELIHVVAAVTCNERAVAFEDLYCSVDRAGLLPKHLVMFLKETDYSAWRLLHLAYLEESKIPPDLSETQLQEDFHHMVKSQTLWGAFLEGKLVAIANLNAYVCDLAQLGGVYTHPAFRQRGFAHAIIQQILIDLPTVHQMSRLKIFTQEDNVGARRLYEKLGISPQGFFAAMFTA